LEPQSTGFFLVLIGVFAALVWWLVVAKQLVFRVLAACLAFIPAMLFGVAAVNKYYDYYQNWNSAISDMTNSNAGTERAAERAARAKQARTAARHRLTPSPDPGRGYLGWRGRAAQPSSRMRTCSTDRWCSAARSARCRPSSR
jgi:hypothetical protein